ncbi:choice-of-anchor L domain-containing protein [Sulfuricurvum sp.]|uniref:choice-of-anchor L domain-containing protein n=1 Tax=Sulfuricurvum sp. TaxID=2025608 RepID=UPI00261B8271|nr:choice-of-anchor L domain-containing protein [Sulfuricurvum sp.]MDD3597933.1 choice-of-anchor L domain-containing protein [Sulfuricurvum sp.]
MKILCYLRIVSMIILMNTYIYAVPNCVSGATAAQLAERIQGNGITITNPVLRVGSNQQAGLFTNGIAGAGLEIDEGIILTGMNVQEACTTNDKWNTSIDNLDITPDTDLLAIDSRAKYDTVVFEFDVTLGENTRLLMLDYQFASEEYNEYVGSQFNDAFGFFISGGDLTQTYNVARVVDDSTIVTTANIFNYNTVTVNNVNNGSVGAYDDTTSQILTNSQYFINNCKKGTGVPNCTQTTPPVAVEFDGLTHRLHATLDNLTPGETYHFKMAIADTGDSAWDTGVFVNKIQGIRAPKLCYDYAYEQNDQFLTDKTFIGQTPQIKAEVLPNENVDVSVYIKNEETSELGAKNIKVSVNDINTSQAVYTAQTVSVVYPGEISAKSIADGTNGMSVANSYIHDIPIGDLEATEGFFIYYGLTPSVSSLDLPLNIDVSFNMEIQGFMVPFQGTLGSDKIPMCSGSTNYSAVPGIFNAVDPLANTAADFVQGAVTTKNNLPTQVANRPTDVEIVSYNPSNFNQVKATNTMLSIEMIDMGGYFDTNSSCADPKKAITERAWMQFGDTDANVTHATFSSSLLGTGFNPSISSTEFYKKVRENTAYRISYNLGDDNGSVHIDRLSNGKYKLTNFTTYAGDPCTSDIDGNPNSQDTVPQWCGSNGGGAGTGMSPSELRTCMECIFGKKTRMICSRDNFAIRPEAFNIVIKDPINGVIIPADANLSAEYLYRFDINATNHINSQATSGYVASYDGDSPAPDRNVTLQWSPNGRVVTGCNDTGSPGLSFKFVGGKIENQLRNRQNVGRYQLQMRDKKWTRVDQSPAHHIGTINWLEGDDCVDGSNVPLYDTTKTYSDNLVGCTVSSNHTKLSDPVTTFEDYNITFKPHRFAFGTIGNLFKNGVGKIVDPIIAGTRRFVYDSNISKDSDMNMSVRMEGIVQAVGANGGELSNFVDNCYASDLNFTVSHSANTAITPLFDYRMINKDANNTNIKLYDSDKISFNTTPIMFVSDGNFSKNGRGKMYTEIRINYDRNTTTPINPRIVHYQDINVTCSNSIDCIRTANGISEEANGSNLLNFDVIHFYGRAQGMYSRIKAPVNTNVATGNVRIGFESYCDFNRTTCAQFFGNGIALTGEDTNWYKNIDHNLTIYGNGDLDGIITQKNGAGNVNINDIKISNGNI